MEPRSFEEFWPFYVGEHRNQTSRTLHYIGTSAGYAIALTSVATLNPLLMPVALVAGYGPAWVGHYVFEKNKPASFKYPLWSFMGDMKMLAYGVTGRMGGEIARLEKTGFRFQAAAA
jgi:hypothetical protein